MYESLTGQRTSLQQITTNNFISNLCSNITNSNHTFFPQQKSQSNKLTIKSLNNMLSIRNNKYKDKQYHKYYDNSFKGITGNLGMGLGIGMGMGIGYNFDYGNNNFGNNKNMQNYTSKNNYNQSNIQFCQKWDCKLWDQVFQNFVQRFGQFSIDSQINIESQINDKAQQKDMCKLVKILKYINNQYITHQKQGNIPDRRGLRLIQLFEPKDIFFKQLLRQLQIIQHSQNIDLTIITKILSKHINKQKLYEKLTKLALQNTVPNLPQNKYKTIFYLFLAQPISNRPLLSRYLYQLNQQILFSLIRQYDQFFKQNKKYTFKQIQQFQQKVNKFIQNKKLLMSQVGIYQNKQYQGNYYMECLACMMSLQKDFIIPEQTDFQTIIYLIIFKIFNWADVKLQTNTQQQNLQKIIYNRFIHTRAIILNQKSILKQIQPYILHLYLLSYQSSFNLAMSSQTFNKNSISKLLLILTTLYQSQKISKIFNFNLISPISLLEYFREQLTKQIKNIQNIKQIIQICNQIVFLLKIQDRFDILLQSKQIVQGVNLQNICNLMNKQQQKQFIRVIIIGSIHIYKNTASFLNTGLPIQKILPYFQIQILLQGLKSILTLNTILSQKSKQKFFGMMSVYRGQQIPEQHQFKMTILEMLFQWYILHQAILQQDYKSLGLSLKCNLQEHQISQQYQLGLSLRLSQSSRGGQTARVHNYQYVGKIGGQWFIDCLKSNQQYQGLYIDYMYIIAQAIIKIKQSKQKLIKRSKLELWIQAYLVKIRNNMREARGNFYKKLNELRQNSLKIFSMHSM